MQGGGGGMDGHFAKKLHHNARYSFLVCRRGSLLKNAWKNLHNKKKYRYLTKTIATHPRELEKLISNKNHFINRSRILT